MFAVELETHTFLSALALHLIHYAVSNRVNLEFGLWTPLRPVAKKAAVYGQYNVPGCTLHEVPNVAGESDVNPFPNKLPR